MALSFRISHWFAIPLIALLLGACESSETVTAKHEQFSGYLDNYDQLTYLKEKNAFIFKNQAAEEYSKIYLGEVVLYGADKVKDEKLAQDATAYIRESVESILRHKGVLSETKEGEGVAVLNLAITATERTMEDIQNYKFTPASFVFASDSDSADSMFIEAALEAELKDANSDERLIALVQQGFGETEQNDGTNLTFDDVIPLIDEWLIKCEETVESFKEI